MQFDKEFDAVISLCQGAFGLAGKPQIPVGLNDPDGEILKRMSASLVSGGKVALSALEEGDTFYADHGVNHEIASLKNTDGKEVKKDLWTSCFTPRELRLLAANAGLAVEHIWSVSPGKYERLPATYRKPEFLVIATR